MRDWLTFVVPKVVPVPRVGQVLVRRVGSLLGSLLGLVFGVGPALRLMRAVVPALRLALAVGPVLGLVLGVAASDAMGQPADCQTRPAAGPSLPLAIDLAGRPGVPAGVTGKIFVAVPMQAPQTECSEPSAPSDVLRGAPGDLLLGTASPARTR
jgi:hypothetical protein